MLRLSLEVQVVSSGHDLLMETPTAVEAVVVVSLKRHFSPVRPDPISPAF